MVTIEQIKAARALINWAQQDLADQTGLSKTAIANVESGKHRPTEKNMQNMIDAFDRNGVEFIDGGVRQKQDLLRVFEGKDANEHLLNDVYYTLKDTGGEVLISGIEEVKENHPSYQQIKTHIERLQSIKVKERMLLKHGDTNFIAPLPWYRWMPEEYYTPVPYQLYGSKLAMISWGPPCKIVIIDNPLFAEAFKGMFNFIWDQSEPVAKAVAVGE